MKIKIKAVLAGGAAAAAIAAALSGAGSANANTTTFLSAMHDAGFSSDVNGDASLVNNGRLVCQYLNEGHSRDYAINQAYQAAQGDATCADAQQFVGIAEANLC
jgi:hypothetical protein